MGSALLLLSSSIYAQNSASSNSDVTLSQKNIEFSANQAIKSATKEYNDITDQRPLETVLDPLEENAKDRQQEKIKKQVKKAVVNEYEDITDQRAFENIQDNAEDRQQK